MGCLCKLGGSGKLSLFYAGAAFESQRHEGKCNLSGCLQDNPIPHVFNATRLVRDVQNVHKLGKCMNSCILYHPRSKTRAGNLLRSI